MNDEQTSPSPVQPQPGWRALGANDKLQDGDEISGFGRWHPIHEWRVGMRVATQGPFQFRRREGGERKWALTIEDAQEKRVCRICQVDDRPRDGNPLVLKYGEEYAHKKCIEQHPEFPPVHRVSDCQGCKDLRARLAEVERELQAEIKCRVHYWEKSLTQKRSMDDGIKVMNACSEQLTAWRKVIEFVASEECYCADFVAAKGPCGSCMAKAALGGEWDKCKSTEDRLRAENAALREKHETLRMCTSNMLRNLNFEIFPAEALIAEANMLTKCDECQGTGYISTGSPDIKSVECPRCREQLGKGEG